MILYHRQATHARDFALNKEICFGCKSRQKPRCFASQGIAAPMINANKLYLRLFYWQKCNKRNADFDSKMPI